MSKICRFSQCEPCSIPPALRASRNVARSFRVVMRSARSSWAGFIVI